MSSTTAVAIAAIIGTAVTAVAGLFVQLLIATRSLRRDKRKRRYDELIEVYAKVGFGMSMATAHVQRLAGGLIDGEEKWPVTALPRQLDVRLANLTPPTSVEHARRTLRLFGASPTVLEAFDEWRNMLSEALSADSIPKLVEWTATRPALLASKLDEYHVTASAHARSKL